MSHAREAGGPQGARGGAAARHRGHPLLERQALHLHVGLGGAGLSPPIRAGLAARVTPDTQQALFVGRALANNLGAAAGPLLGALLALADARLAFVASAWKNCFRTSGVTGDPQFAGPSPSGFGSCQTSSLSIQNWVKCT